MAQARKPIHFLEQDLLRLTVLESKSTESERLPHIQDAIDAIVKIRDVEAEYKKKYPDKKFDFTCSLDVEDEKSGDTSLTRAASLGQVKILIALLKAGADPNKFNMKIENAPLHSAAINDQPDVIKALLDAKANIDMPNGKNKATPLALAAGHGSLQSVKVLLDAKADISKPVKSGGTPLMIVAQSGRLGIVDILLHVKADVNDVNKVYGIGALNYAVGNNHIHGAKMLLEAKADISCITKLRKSDMTIFEVTAKDQAEMLTLLLDGGLSLACRLPGAGTTLLIAAASKDSTDVMKTLLKINVDINAVDRDGKSALDHAIEKKHLAAVVLLLMHNAKISNEKVLRDFLSSKEIAIPGDAKISQCLKDFFSHKAASLMDEKQRASAQLCVGKLDALHKAHEELWLSSVDEALGFRLPEPLRKMILNYDDRFKKVNYPLSFFPPKIDSALAKLKSEIQKLNMTKKSEIIRDIEEALKLKP